MALIADGVTTTQLLAVDSSHKALRSSIRPLEPSTLGHYRIGAQSGILTSASVAAGGTLFSFRWADATRLAVVTKLKATMVPLTAFTAAQEVGLNAFIARTFSASDSGGTPIVVTGNNQKVRASFGSSLATDIRIGTTATITAGTRTPDAVAFASATGLVAAAAAAGTLPVPPVIDFNANVMNGESPIILANNEGIIVTNTIVFPAAGNARLVVEMAWAETLAY